MVTHHPGTLGSYCLRALQLAQGVKLLPFLGSLLQGTEHLLPRSQIPFQRGLRIHRREPNGRRPSWIHPVGKDTLEAPCASPGPGLYIQMRYVLTQCPTVLRSPSLAPGSPPGPLRCPGPPLQLSYVGALPRGQERRPRSDLCTPQRATSPKPLKGATKLLAPAGTVDQRPPARPQKAMPPGSRVLFPTGCPVCPAVCDGAHMRCSEEHLSAPLSSFHPRSALKVLLSTHPGSLCPLWPILSPLTLAPPVPRQAMPGPVATLTPSSSQPKAALLAGTTAAPTNPGLPRPEPTGVLPADHHPVHTCPCQISDATGSPQKHRFRVTPAWPR